MISKNSFIQVHFVDSKEIQRVNKEYRSKDKSTDVLSCNMDVTLPDKRYYIGDILINVDDLTNEKNEKAQKTKIAKLVEHGVLHLLGIHHKDDE